MVWMAASRALPPDDEPPPHAHPDPRMDFAHEGGGGSGGGALRLRGRAARSRRPAPLCRICYTAGDGGERWTCRSCTQSACLGCYARWLTSQVGRAPPLHCPFCPAVVPTSDVATHCAPHVAERHAYLKARRDHAGNPDALWCATDGCMTLLRTAVAAGEPRHADVHCAACGQSTCGKCHAAAHAGRCATPKGTGGMRTAVWRKANARRCPTCRVWIQRDGGCSEMECTLCATSFCYRCGTKYTRTTLGGATVDGCRCIRMRRGALRAARSGALVVALPLLVAAATIGGPAAALLYAASTHDRRAKADRAFEHFFGGGGAARGDAFGDPNFDDADLFEAEYAAHRRFARRHRRLSDEQLWTRLRQQADRPHTHSPQSELDTDESRDEAVGDAADEGDDDDDERHSV